MSTKKETAQGGLGSTGMLSVKKPPTVVEGQSLTYPFWVFADIPDEEQKANTQDRAK